MKYFDSRYLINRTAGGINGEFDERVRNVMLLGSRKTSELE